MNKRDMLKEALEPRKLDVLTYQVNIDNFERAIHILDTTNSWDFEPEMREAMAEYRKDLARLLWENRVQQTKSLVILWAIEQQLEE